MSAHLLLNDEILTAGESHPVIRLDPTWPWGIPKNNYTVEFKLNIPQVPSGRTPKEAFSAGWVVAEKLRAARRARKAICDRRRYRSENGLAAERPVWERQQEVTP